MATAIYPYVKFPRPFSFEGPVEQILDEASRVYYDLAMRIVESEDGVDSYPSIRRKKLLEKSLRVREELIPVLLDEEADWRLGLELENLDFYNINPEKPTHRRLALTGVYAALALAESLAFANAVFNRVGVLSEVRSELLESL